MNSYVWAFLIAICQPTRALPAQAPTLQSGAA